ncbi:ribonuclease D [Pseudochrobactrum algeriensis]|uniref:Ribonuclease D n=1 Tax=Pseudochrobactrum saccharolyticum TaxID=354352 RepID=A0A7W8ALX6_9HYPH|nr:MULTISPECIES: ribonuclease D [Pseudochrobactrum]MBX8784777.1 ribonuclease D [Ochrobactrum sp. GRS2]KAB0539897.1 ribonuclease D [Pseudochrobactrum saccharolyticum]MBB5092751.1 ribonuclease D [Pseudochrobactrum saccharolyticum]MDP8251239.1 ribonuclease D [Pseudochrobactrum saccharolyticum]QVQ37812.1 ribonuclease D [Pseudochrobactrum algeriensis]
MELITTTQGLEQAVSQLSKSDFVTVDTEFIRETTFWPELCLIQMASPDTTALVDALAPGIDLSSFFALMADKSVVKVFHAARQDIEIVFHLGNLIPEPVFDTQVAAMVCGFGDAISYDQLVARITGVNLDKSSRFTDWRRRPLSDKQLDYALADVTHLRDVYLYLQDRLTKEGRNDWVSEEIRILTARETYDMHPDDAWKRLKIRLRKPAELAVMQKVAAWRERAARERNVPRGRVIKDDTIQEIAQQQPRDAEALSRLRTIPKGWERSSHAQGLVEAINEALSIPKEDMPRLPKQYNAPEGTGAASDVLKLLLKIITEDHGVAPKVVASSDDIDQIAAKGNAADVPALKGWRRELFGEKALQMIEGKIGIKFENRKIKAVPLD